MKYLKYLFIFVCVISFFSCERKNYGFLKKENMNVIEKYIDSDSLSHTSYLIMSVNECVRNNQSLSGFVIGPLYANMWPSFKEERCHEIYLYKGKHIYLYTHLSDILEFPPKEQPISYCEKESYSIGNEYSKALIASYFKKAWIVSFSDNKVLQKSNVDQLFLPKIELQLEKE